MIFLIDYDRREGKIVTMQAFDESRRREAYDERLQLELAHNKEGFEREVVLLEAENEQAIQKTHRRYFESLEELGKLPEAKLGA